jgi:hypothetical protein
MGHLARNARLLVAGLAIVALGAAACGGGTPSLAAAKPASQALRTCVDRWNQDTMVGYGFLAGHLEVAMVRPGHLLALATGVRGHQKRCVLMFGPEKAHPVYCVLAPSGAFYCPYSPVEGPRRTTTNATLGKDGVLTLDISLSGTHAARPLAWQRYPHVDSYVHPWTSAGRLRPGLRLRPWKLGHGPCTTGTEEIPDPVALQCVVAVGRAGPCYPQKRHWGPGDIAACGGVGPTFYRWRITGGSAS